MNRQKNRLVKCYPTDQPKREKRIEKIQKSFSILTLITEGEN